MTRPDLDAIEERVNACPDRLSYDDGITDDLADPPERGKPRAIYGDGGIWLADLDCGMVADDVVDAFGVFVAHARTDIPALVAYVRELEVALLNERGEGEPPCGGWRWADCSGWGWAWVFGGGPDEWIAVHHKPCVGWYVRLGPALVRLHAQVAISYDTARAAMLAADAALGGQVTIPDQPPPIPATGDVWREMIDALGPDLDPATVSAMEERRAIGIDRYSTPLQRDNGRDHLIDARQELLDAAVYLWAAGREGAAVDALTLMESL